MEKIIIENKKAQTGEMLTHLSLGTKLLILPYKEYYEFKKEIPKNNEGYYMNLRELIERLFNTYNETLPKIIITHE